METEFGDEIGKSKTIGPEQIEWNRDFDEQWFENIRLKGRCRNCWGGLIGKQGDDPAPTAIRCRVCNILLEGNDAKNEYQQMLEQVILNNLNMPLGHPPKYHDNAKFVNKIILPINRQPEDKFHQHARASKRKGKTGWLTRKEYPAGSAGYLFMQARALMSGVERLPRDLSVVRFWDFDLHNDGSATLHISKQELREHPKTREYELLKALGSTMTNAMMSAFACELTLKAIRLTRMDEARKSHDLWCLYCDLPEDSKARIKEDCPEVESVLEGARDTFDKERYFGANDIASMGVMINTERALALAKVARVLLDEAEMMGLGFTVNIHATQTVTKAIGRPDGRTNIKYKMRVQGTEWGTE